MTQYPDLFAALAAPFDPQEVKVRAAPGGRQLHYITARTAMNRLDSVLGPENWWDEFLPMENSVICKLSIRLPDGSVITKADAGGYAGMADQGDDDKSGFSDAMKRAAAKYGIGRYLYRDGVPDFRVNGPARPASPAPPPPPVNGHAHAPAPRMAPSVYPNGSPGDPVPVVEDRHPPRPPANGSGANQPPRSGKALYPWVKEREQRINVGVFNYIVGWAKMAGFPSRMVEWNEDQVARAVAEIHHKFASDLGSPGPQPAEPPGPGPVTKAHKAAQDGLYRRVRKILEIQFPGVELEMRHVEQALKLLRNEAPDLPALLDIYSCTDVPLLTEYAELAQLQLERLQPEPSEAPY